MTPQYILKASLCRPAHCDDSPHRLRHAESEIDNLRYAPDYSEPGYASPDKGVLFANWNHFPSKVGDILERYGFAIEWYDEWATCEDCGKAVRMSPDSYIWQPSYVLMNECEIICLDCVDWPDLLHEEYEDNPDIAVPSSCHLGEYGYSLVEDGFESGFYPGQNDRPADILARLHRSGHERVVFRISGKGQFDIGFEAWEPAPHD